MPEQDVTIKNLITSAAEGASLGVSELLKADPPIPVELEEFEIEVTYAAETEVIKKNETEIGLKFKVLKAKIGHSRSSRSKATYGLKVRFLFSGKSSDETTPTP